jgi:predicted RNase H-like HicB family nuclease
VIHYPALFEPDAKKGGFVVTFPDFDWGVTQGETEAETIEMAEDALICIIEENHSPISKIDVGRASSGVKSIERSQ